MPSITAQSATMSDFGSIQRHAELSGRCLLLRPTADIGCAGASPVICQHAPWWIFGVRGSDTPLAGIDEPGTPRGCWRA